MKLTWILLPAMAVAFAAGEATRLASMTLRYEDLPVRVNGENKSRAMLDGTTHTGSAVDLHETELAPGLAPHPAHHHAHEEMILIREGRMEVTISGKTSRLGHGSVAYVASNEEHGWRNVGSDRARYFVLALNRQK